MQRYKLSTAHFEDGFEAESAINLKGDYIGTRREAALFCDKLGIHPELAKPWHKVCSVGLSDKDFKWYGWSHRAIAWFSTRAEAVAFAEDIS